MAIEHQYIESEIPQEEQKYKGWFWYHPIKQFHRWSDHIELCKQHDEMEMKRKADGS